MVLPQRGHSPDMADRVYPWMQRNEGARVMRILRVAGLFAGIALTVAACGEQPGTRAVTGGLIGAGAGAALGAATGGNPGTGALIGGGVGAVGGAVTAPRRY